MAARLNPRHQDMVRDKIKASQLINRLQDHVFAKSDDEQAVMSDSQVRAALGLLKKCVADLSQATLSNPDGTPLNFMLTVPPKASGPLGPQP